MLQRNRKNKTHKTFVALSALCLSLGLVLGGCSLFDSPSNPDTTVSSVGPSTSEISLKTTTTESLTTSVLTSSSVNLTSTETTEESRVTETTDKPLPTPEPTTPQTTLPETEESSLPSPTPVPEAPSKPVLKPAASPSPLPTPTPTPTKAPVMEVSFSITVDPYLVENPDEIKDEVARGMVTAYNGVFRSASAVPIREEDTALSLLLQICRQENIPLEVEEQFLGVYVKSINLLAEKMAGGVSGWTYEVNGYQPPLGADRYTLEPGDVLEWIYMKG